MDQEQAVTFPGATRTPSQAQVGPLTLREWLVCAVAGVGFLFDTYEIVVQGLVVRPALLDMTGWEAGSPQFNRWVGWILYFPFLAGGIAGLLGGYLTDRFGRRQMLVASIVLYGVATAAAAYATSPAELLFWRCVTIVGVCTEWIAATAWIAELFDDRRRRDAALGFTQAMAGIGVFLVAVVYYLGVTYGHLLPAIQQSHSGWRYALLFGALPVLPVLLARLRLPESPRWLQLHASGALHRPAFRELFQPELRRITIVSSMMVASIYGMAFGVILHLPRIVPGLDGVRDLPRMQQEQSISLVHLVGDIGSVIGRFALAFLAITLLTRRQVWRAFLLPGMILFPALFAVAPYVDVTVLAAGALLAGIALNGQLNFIGNYLPLVYPARLRGTGESFAISVGGRIIGTSTSFITPWLANFTPGDNASSKLAFAAAAMAVVACILALVTSQFLVEPKQAVAAEKT
ncbi:MAG TPA: MFS transporter [Steroidobacteraceae bacterium]|nr:MFS transporter [Steroidobacteraceae bacterium]